MIVQSRSAFGAVAVVAWAGELIFFVANARAFGSVLASLWWTASFLTDWSGLLVAVVCTAAAVGWPRLSSPFWLGLATVAIVLVGTMFAVMGGWAHLGVRSLSNAFGLSSVLAHVVTPWLMLAVWLFAAPHGVLPWRIAPRFMLWPLAYLAQMFVRGLSGGGYPYPEVDVSRLGWSPVLLFCGAVVLLFLLLGTLLVGVDRLLIPSRKGERRAATRTTGFHSE